MRIARLPAASLQQLEQELRRLDLAPYLHRGQPAKVKASLHNARFKRADVAAAKVASALKLSSSGRRAPLELMLRVQGREATLSIDASGLLHRRGYRQATAKAPLRENLAASVLRAAGWRPGVPLADPLCGSGSFSIEAAQMSQERAPGLDLKLPVVQLPSFPATTWNTLCREARQSEQPQQGWFHTADRDPGAIAATTSNAARAGVELNPLQQDIGVEVAAPAGPGLVVLNPPYGVRVAANVQLASLYHRMGEALRRDYPGWRVAAIGPDKALAGRLAKGIEELTSFKTGGLQVRLWIGQLPG